MDKMVTGREDKSAEEGGADNRWPFRAANGRLRPCICGAVQNYHLSCCWSIACPGKGREAAVQAVELILQVAKLPKSSARAT